MSALTRVLRATGVIDLLDRSVAGDALRLAALAVRRPRAARQELDVLRDHRAFRRRYGFLASGADLADPARKVLVVSLTDVVAQVKTEAMLAKALQLHGVAPVILTNSFYRRASRYFRVFGYRDIVHFDQVRQTVPADDAADVIGGALAGRISFQSLLELEYRGAAVGRHVLASVLQAFRHRNADLQDPEVRRYLQRALTEAVRSVGAAELLFDTVKPEIVLFLERNFTPHGEILDVAVSRGLNTMQWHHPHRSDALILRRFNETNRHRSAFSLSEESWEAVRRMPWTPRHDAELMEELKGRYEQGTWFNRKFLRAAPRRRSGDDVRRALGLAPGRKTAVIFSHVLWDVTFVYGDNLFEDYEEWLVETVKAACANRAVDWIVKLHPDYIWKTKQRGESAPPRDLAVIGKRVGPLPDHVRILLPDTDITTAELYDVVDYCITVRGTVGIEMACFGIPVLLAGTGRYSGLGFTIDSESREQYLDRLRTIDEIPKLSAERTILARKHAYGLFRLRPLPFTTFQLEQMPFDRLGHALDHNVAIRARSRADLTAAPDLRAFAGWAIESRDADYLSARPEEA